MLNLFDWISENTWIFLLVMALIEAILRYVPTKYNLSILDTIYKFLSFFFPPNVVQDRKVQLK